MLRAVLCTLLVLATPALAAAVTFDLGFDNESAQVELSQSLHVDELGSSRVGARFLYNGDEETRLGSAGFSVRGRPGNLPGLEVGVGAQGLAGSTDDDFDLLAAAVTADARYSPPMLRGVGLAAGVGYAPKIFSGLDSDGSLETSLRLGYNVTPRVQVYLGYQNIRADFEDTSDWRTIDEALRLGFEARF